MCKFLYFFLLILHIFSSSCLYVILPFTYNCIKTFPLFLTFVVFVLYIVFLCQLFRVFFRINIQFSSFQFLCVCVLPSFPKHTERRPLYDLSLISGNFQNPVCAKPKLSRCLLSYYNIRYIIHYPIYQ